MDSSVASNHVRAVRNGKRRAPSQSAIHVKGFVNLLKKTFPEIPIEMVDERFTSKMASATIAQSGMNKKNRQNKELVDTISAVILLQSWMGTRF